MGVMDKLMFWKKKDDFGSFDMDSFSSSAKDPLGGTPLHENIGLEHDPFGKDSMSPSPANSSPPGSDPISPAPTTPSDFGANHDSLRPKAFDQKKEYSGNRDLELISSKLDTIKAILQSLDSRVNVIERIAKQEEQEQNQSHNNQNHNLW